MRSPTRGVSRRRVLKSAGTAALGGGAVLLGRSTAVRAGQAPAVLSGTQTGRLFRALVRHGATLDVQELRLLPIDPRQVVIRSQAVAPCYTIVRGALGTANVARAEVPNHCGFGVVEAVGQLVKRVQVGDRVVVAGTSQCGQCYQCLHGRADYCQFTFFSPPPGVDAFPPFAEMRDGTKVYAQAGIGGISEMMVVFEEYCVPVFTDLPAAELTLLGDQLASGFAAGHARLHFEPGSDVAVFGCGPVGIGAIQAARVVGAAQIIAIDPVRYRREFALKMGATIALDPVAEGDGLVERVRELCRGPHDRRFAGGTTWGRGGNAAMARGADFVVEAAGVQAFPPKVEPQPDPTNVRTVQQAWDSTRMGGHVMLMGLTLQPVPFPGPALALLGRTIHPGQQGGLHALRDIPRYVKLIERGRIDARSMITRRYTLDEARQAIQDTADRTIITGVVEF
ncbi:MAG TPA: zinc-binding dehydrogenase [Vicinamibacterales bacterium]|nr:zinc-binding dehydrogenase [Vicinamibacterales bacterium]